jgi:hypothetical protein
MSRTAIITLLLAALQGSFWAYVAWFHGVSKRDGLALVSFRPYASGKHVLMLTFLQVPFWVGALRLLQPDATRAFLGITDSEVRALPAMAVVLMALLFLWWLTPLLTAAVNAHALRRWGGPTARTEGFKVVLFYCLLIAKTICFLLVGTCILALITFKISHAPEYLASGRRPEYDPGLILLEVGGLCAMLYACVMQLVQAEYPETDALAQ